MRRESQINALQQDIACDILDTVKLKEHNKISHNIWVCGINTLFIAPKCWLKISSGFGAPYSKRFDT